MKLTKKSVKTNTSKGFSDNGKGLKTTENVFGETVNQTGTAGFTALQIAPYVNTSGSGNYYLINAGTNTAAAGAGTHTNKFTVDNSGNGFFSGGLSLGTAHALLSEQNRSSKTSGNAYIDTAYGFVSNTQNFLELRGFAPPNMYRTTMDRPAPYGLGFGDGLESGGIMPIGAGDNLQEIMFYGSNSGPTTFTWKHQVWESTAQDPLGSNTYSAPAMSLNANTGQLYVSGNVGIGTLNPQSELAVNGTVTSRKVVVTQTGWSDFVFEPTYQLRSLPSVESYIKQHKHLPDVPSATEVEKNGVDLGTTQSGLLRKIEELTLYAIEQDKRQQQLEKQNHEQVEMIKSQAKVLQQLQVELNKLKKSK